MNCPKCSGVLYAAVYPPESIHNFCLRCGNCTYNRIAGKNEDPSKYPQASYEEVQDIRDGFTQGVLF